MSDELSIQGALAETTVPDLFRSLVRSGETAIVSLDTAGRNDVIYFSDGRIIYASSTDPDLGLGEILLRHGELNLQQYNNAMERIVVARRMGAVLVELGYIKPDELLRAVEQQANAIVLSAMSFRNGNYTIEFTSQWPEGIIALPLSTERLMLDGIRSIEHWSLILRGIMRFERLLESVPGAEMRGYALELNDDESHIHSFFTQPQTVESVCARSYLTNFVTCRTLWGLLAVNLLQDAESEMVHEKRAATASEYELEGMVERYNTVFQGIFSLVFQKIGDHIYDFVDRVVLHVSPAALPYLNGMNLVNEARIDFDQLFNNMIASGASDHEAIVQNVLNELLAGWVVEAKQEFGEELGKEVQQLADSVSE